VPESLRDRVAIVTGAGQGIGLGIARALGEAGARVVIADIVPGRLERARVSLDANDIEADAELCDVTDAAAVDRLMAEAHSRYGHIDILVNNAGVVIVKPIDEQTEHDWDTVVDVNLKGSFLCSRAAVAPMSATGSGVIINLCSIAAFGFTTPHVPYSASKAGVIGLTRDFAVELAPRGIRVNAIAPGPIETPMFDGLTAAQKAAHAAKVPLGRLGQPADIGAAAVFLASDDAAFITGAVLPVSGGSDLKLS